MDYTTRGRVSVHKTPMCHEPLVYGVNDEKEVVSVTKRCLLVPEIRYITKFRKKSLFIGEGRI